MTVAMNTQGETLCYGNVAADVMRRVGLQEDAVCQIGALTKMCVLEKDLRTTILTNLGTAFLASANGNAGEMVQKLGVVVADDFKQASTAFAGATQGRNSFLLEQSWQEKAADGRLPLDRSLPYRLGRIIFRSAATRAAQPAVKG